MSINLPTTGYNSKLSFGDNNLIGGNVTCNCTVELSDVLYGTTINISIINNQGNSIANSISTLNSMVSLIKNINYILASKAGEYECITIISHTLTGYQTNNTIYELLNLTCK